MRTLQIFKKLSEPINIVFTIAITLFILIAFGIIPREAAFIFLLLYVVFVLFYPVERGVELFLRSIPFFIALPISATFDNFNIWRVLLLLIFVKWFFVEYDWRTIFKSKRLDRVWLWAKQNKVEFLGVVFFGFAALSLLVAPDFIPGVRRLIFVANAAMLFVVVRSLVLKNRKNAAGFIKNFAYSGILAVLFGYLQFIAAYLVPAWIFHYWWGQVISVNLYGAEWGDIATNFGNTWFSYSGDTLRLRMFSTFPDSHSFPMYVIMALPGILFLFAKKFGTNLKKLRATVPLAIIMLALILTGTRGIWIAILAVLLVAGLFKISRVNKKFIRAGFVLFLIFLMMFPAYYAIVSFPQFQDSEFTGSASLNRIRSVLDFGETSNEARIHIWKQTVEYIKKSPVFGIGIGNYPYILSEPQEAARAGSSAHNLYLDIASTMGIGALLVFLWMMIKYVKNIIVYLKQKVNTEWALYIAVTLFSLAWVGAYLMTDSALYDGRALLAFMFIFGIGNAIIARRP